MEKTRLSLLLSALPLLSLYGCDIGSDETLVTSGGVVNKGILSQAIAQVYKAGTTDLVKRVYTEIDGTFKLDDINFNGTLYVEVTTTSQTLATCDSASGCGNYTGGIKQAGEFDENLNGIIDFGDKYFFHDTAFKLTAFIKPSNGSDAGKFAVTPLTHLAAEKISQLENISPDNITLVNAQVAELFGLNGTDITRVIPPDITNEDAMLNAGPSQQLYAALNAAVASAATSTNTSVANVIETLVTGFKKDGGLVGNSNDANKVTLASLQTLAKDVVKTVETKYPSVNLTPITTQIEQEIQEQSNKPTDEVVVPSNEPSLKPDFDKDGIADEDEHGLPDSTEPDNPDTDNDGMYDGWEVLYGFNPLSSDENGNGINDGLEDFDGDGLNNHAESFINTNPNNADTDGNGVTDGQEDFDNDGLNNIGEYENYSDPFHADSDGDGLSDGDEVHIHNTSPMISDTDGDGLPDGWEVTYGLEPVSTDDSTGNPDSDSLNNYQEYVLGTNPKNANTGNEAFDGDLDGDGITNIDELNNGLNPFVNDASLDKDGDSISNIDEITNSSDVSVANPIIEFVSDAQIYTNSTTGSLDMAVSVDESLIVATQYDVTDLDISGVDTGGLYDILIHNLVSDTYELPVKDYLTPSTLLDGGSKFLDLSKDSHSILFSSLATNAVSVDGGYEDVFVYNRITKTTKRLGTDALINNNSQNGKFSGDGKQVFMETYSTTFFSPDSNGFGDVVTYDLNDDNISLVSKDYIGTDSSNDQSNVGDISADGQRIVYTSRSTNIVDNAITDTGSFIDVYFVELPNTYKYVSMDKNYGQDHTLADAGWAKISANGKAIVYQTPRDILDLNTGAPGAGFNQLFYVDVDKMLAGDPVDQYTTLITKSYDNSNNGYSDGHADGGSLHISADGQRVFFKSQAQKLVNTDVSAAAIEDLFVWEASSETIYLVSQYVYGMTGVSLNYDASPGSHGSGMGVRDFTVNADGTHIYAMLNYGDEYNDGGSNCSGPANYCLYKIKVPLPVSDADNDGLSDLAELELTSNINNPDTDGDGLSDGDEVFIHKTSPINPDTDGDSVHDGQEINNGTDPLDPDS